MKKIKILAVIIFAIFMGAQAFGASFVVNPSFQAIESGTPVSGGLVYTYECGTTTNKTTYTSYDEGTPNANPVVLDSNGQAGIYAKGCLKIVLKTSAGATLDTWDNLRGFDQTILQDADRDTKIQMEESADEDTIRFDVSGSQKMYIDSDGVHIGTTVTGEDHGRLERATFAFASATSITIGAGAYHHSGTSDQFVYWSSPITFTDDSGGSNSDSSSGEGWNYLYLDDSAIITQASNLLDADCFVNNTTAPSWSATKQGWYNGNDRCIFAFYISVGSIKEFYHDGGNLVIKVGAQYPVADDIDTTWTDDTLDMPGFSTKAEIVGDLEVKTADAIVSVFYRKNGASDSTGNNIAGLERIGTDQMLIFTGTVITDSSQTVEIKLSRSGDDLVDIEASGWYFPRGM